MNPMKMLKQAQQAQAQMEAPNQALYQRVPQGGEFQWPSDQLKGAQGSRKTKVFGAGC